MLFNFRLASSSCRAAAERTFAKLCLTTLSTDVSLRHLANLANLLQDEGLSRYYEVLAIQLPITHHANAFRLGFQNMPAVPIDVRDLFGYCF